MESSSSSNRRGSAIARRVPETRPREMTDALKLRELPDLALDLGIDVERRLPGARPAEVAGDHQLADLRLQLGVEPRGGQFRQLLLHVHRRLPPAGPAGGCP